MYSYTTFQQIHLSYIHTNLPSFSKANSTPKIGFFEKTSCSVFNSLKISSNFSTGSIRNPLCVMMMMMMMFT
jgi:hypothetical protein